MGLLGIVLDKARWLSQRLTKGCVLLRPTISHPFLGGSVRPDTEDVMQHDGFDEEA